MITFSFKIKSKGNGKKCENRENDLKKGFKKLKSKESMGQTLDNNKSCAINVKSVKQGKNSFYEGEQF